MYCVTMYQKFKAILILQIQLKKACHTQTKLLHYIKRFAKSEIIVIYTVHSGQVLYFDFRPLFKQKHLLRKTVINLSKGPISLEIYK